MECAGETSRCCKREETTKLDKSSRNVNEYSVTGGVECELKFENDAANNESDKSRLFKSVSTPLKKPSSVSVEKENTYVVSTPIQVREPAPRSADGSLQIYEVDFDNNVAYIIPNVSTCVLATPRHKDDAEIYHVMIHDF